MNNYEVQGIKYSMPKVFLIKDSGLSQCEIGARICYDSFAQSENDLIKGFLDGEINDNISNIRFNDIDGSELLSNLAHVNFHHSVLEHTNLTFMILGISRAVLQEVVRTRIASYSVRSTRYTMSSIINAYVATFADHRTITGLRRKYFIDKILEFDMFVTSDKEYNELEAGSMFDKLDYQYNKIGRAAFLEAAVAKSSMDLVKVSLASNDFESLFAALENGKKKRNVGDSFKNIIPETTKVDMVVTMNLRGLKNYFSLRDSGAAYFQIRHLAQEMKKVIPQKYLDLIEKSQEQKDKEQSIKDKERDRITELERKASLYDSIQEKE